MPWLMQLEIHPRVKILGFSGLLNVVDLKIIFYGLSLKLAHEIWLAISTGKLLSWNFTRYLHSSIYSRSLELRIFTTCHLFLELTYKTNIITFATFFLMLFNLIYNILENEIHVRILHFLFP